MKLLEKNNEFVVTVNNHAETLALFSLIKTKLNINDVEEHDSSYYLNDTYWLMNQGFWTAQFFYTACLDSENLQLNGKIHLGVLIKSDVLTDAALSAISDYLIKIIELKHKIIIDSEICPGLCDEEHALLAKFCMQF